MSFVYTFLIGGAFCVIAQLLISKTTMTPARILVLYVVAGVVLYAFGLYQPLVDLAGSGALVPLTGFGYALGEGTKEAVKEMGLLGAFVGGVKATAAGIAAAVFFGFIMAVLFKPKVNK